MSVLSTTAPAGLRIAAALTGTGLVLAGCSVTNTPETSAVQTPPPPPATAFDNEAPVPPPSYERTLPVGPKWLETRHIDGLGDFVVDGTGRAVYASSADTATGATCYDQCADTFLPILTEDTPAGGIGIQVAAADTLARRDGSLQLTYQGRPLYWYAGDQMPRAIGGHGVELFGADWFLITPAGDPVAGTDA